MAVTSPLCTRRRFGPPTCPGAFGYCNACPRVPRFTQCPVCHSTTVVQDIEHANRITGGFGCGREGCPPLRWAVAP